MIEINNQESISENKSDVSPIVDQRFQHNTPHDESRSLPQASQLQSMYSQQMIKHSDKANQKTSSISTPFQKQMEHKLGVGSVSDVDHTRDLQMHLDVKGLSYDQFEQKQGMMRTYDGVGPVDGQGFGKNDYKAVIAKIGEARFELNPGSNNVNTFAPNSKESSPPLRSPPKGAPDQYSRLKRGPGGLSHAHSKESLDKWGGGRSISYSPVNQQPIWKKQYYSGEKNPESNEDLAEILVMRSRSNELLQYTKEYQQQQRSKKHFTELHHLKSTQSSAMKRYRKENMDGLKELTDKQKIHKKIINNVVISDVNNDAKLIDRILNAQDQHLALQAHASPTCRNSPELPNPNSDIKVKGLQVMRTERSQSLMNSKTHLKSTQRLKKSKEPSAEKRESVAEEEKPDNESPKAPSTFHQKAHSVHIHKNSFSNSRFIRRHMGMNLTRITEKEMSTPYNQKAPTYSENDDGIANMQIVGTPISTKTPVNTLLNKSGKNDTIPQYTMENSKTPTISAQGKSTQRAPGPIYYDPVHHLTRGPGTQIYENISEQDLSKELSHEQQYFGQLNFLNNSGYENLRQQRPHESQMNKSPILPALVSPLSGGNSSHRITLNNLSNQYNTRLYHVNNQSGSIKLTSPIHTTGKTKHGINTIMVPSSNNHSIAGMSTDLGSGVLLDLRQSPNLNAGHTQHQKFLITNLTQPSDNISFQALKQKEASFVDQLKKYRENSHVEQVIGQVFQNQRNFLLRGSPKDMVKQKSKADLKEEKFLRDFFADDFNGPELQGQKSPTSLAAQKMLKEQTDLSEVDVTQHNQNLTQMKPAYPDQEINNDQLGERTPYNQLRIPVEIYQNQNDLHSPVAKSKSLINKLQMKKYIAETGSQRRTPILQVNNGLISASNGLNIDEKNSSIDQIFAEAIDTQNQQAIIQHNINITPSTMNNHVNTVNNTNRQDGTKSNSYSTKQKILTPMGEMLQMNQQNTELKNSVDTMALNQVPSPSQRGLQKSRETEDKIKIIQNIACEIQNARTNNLFYQEDQNSQYDSRLSHCNYLVNPPQEIKQLNKISSIQKYPDQAMQPRFYRSNQQLTGRQFVNSNSGTFSLNPQQFGQFSEDKMERMTELKNQSNTSILEVFLEGAAPQMKSQVKVISEMKTKKPTNPIHGIHLAQVFLEKKSFGSIPLPAVDQSQFQASTSLLETEVTRNLQKEESRNIFGRSKSTIQSKLGQSQPYATILSGAGIEKSRRLKCLYHDFATSIASQQRSLKHISRNSLPPKLKMKTQISKQVGGHPSSPGSRYNKQKQDNVFIDPKKFVESQQPSLIDNPVIMNLNLLQTGQLGKQQHNGQEQTVETAVKNQFTESTFSNQYANMITKQLSALTTNQNFKQGVPAGQGPAAANALMLNNVGVHQNSPMIRSTLRNQHGHANMQGAQPPQSTLELVGEALHQNKQFQFQGRPQDFEAVHGIQANAAPSIVDDVKIKRSVMASPESNVHQLQLSQRKSSEPSQPSPYRLPFANGTETDFNQQNTSLFNMSPSRIYLNADLYNQLTINEQTSLQDSATIQKGGGNVPGSKTPAQLTPLSFAKSHQESITQTNKDPNASVGLRDQLSTQPMLSDAYIQEGQLASIRAMEDPLFNFQVNGQTPQTYAEMLETNVGSIHSTRTNRIAELKNIVKSSRQEIDKFNQVVRQISLQKSQSKGYIYKQNMFDQYKALQTGVSEIFVRDEHLDSKREIAAVRGNVNSFMPQERQRDEITHFIAKIEELKGKLKLNAPDKVLANVQE